MKITKQWLLNKCTESDLAEIIKDKKQEIELQKVISELKPEEIEDLHTRLITEDFINERKN